LANLKGLFGGKAQEGFNPFPFGGWLTFGRALIGGYWFTGFNLARKVIKETLKKFGGLKREA